MNEISTKPYLLRAIYEWCQDCGYTPYLSVAVDERTVVPTEHVVNGEIVLNVSPSATHGLSIGNDLIEFQARFGGVARQLSIPVENVSAIYARENGHGMAFEVAAPARRPVLAETEAARVPPADGRPALSAVPSPAADASGSDPGDTDETADSTRSDEPDDTPPPSGSRPRLKRVK